MDDQASQYETGFTAILDNMRAARGPDNGEALTDKSLEGLAQGLWDWVSALPEGQRAARLRDSDHGDSLLEVAGPDVPFIVDSVLGECLAQGTEARALFHPIIARDAAAAARGDRWSVIQVHLPPLSTAETKRLQAGIEQTLADLQGVVADFHDMHARMRDERAKLASAVHLQEYDRVEALAFLDWLAADHFVFLGARTYRFEIDADGGFQREEPIMIDGTNLGLLRDEDRNVLSRGAEPTMLTGRVGEFLQSPEPLIIAKSTMISRVHRRVRPDYVGVKHYDDRGRVIGETRFLGLFTAEAYDEAARSVPLIRRRVEQVLALSGARAGGHTAKALANILETWPRDELFQTDAATLAPMVAGVAQLAGRPGTRLFLRRDQFDRFVSAIVYLPRDAYDSDLRQRLVSLIADAFDAEVLRFDPRFDAGGLVRLHIQLALSPGHPEPDPADLEARVTATAIRWEDVFRQTLIESDMADHARDGANLFINGFNAAYREAFTPDDALNDIVQLAELSAGCSVRMRAYRRPDDSEDTVRAKVYSRGQSIALSQSVPVLENMGLFVEFETGYRVRPAAKPREDAPDLYWIHDLKMRQDAGQAIDLQTSGENFENAFAAIWLGEAENDAFNRLIFEVGANWREANLLRGLSAYRRQTGLDPAMASQVRAFVSHPEITANMLKMFHTLFDPVSGDELEARNREAESVLAAVLEQLIAVRSLEDDRVLRRTAQLIMAIQRTNYYQPVSGPLAFKVASGEIEAMPRPVPYREIFVAGPVVEGVHLRFGAVARGGLRWTDRPDDFRTEVLGLVKAQQVKNAVIVPVGSKGGFYPKQLPVNGTREAVRDAGIHAYRIFITALLQLTDNLVDGDVHHPEHMVVRDGADPYLVVAADKGTATFSDIANEISVGQGFWLGDAFASGGSAGYDHKAMGITARGAWEAVKRHFLEEGRDIQSEPFTVIGVGDMSGDVFGNGMLLSRQTRLVAAFNHLHVFVDPNPGDAETMWAERQRLFDLPRSGWADYDTSLISEGGGVFDRSAKSIDLSDEIKALTGLSGATATPDELIHALLKAEADLLWFGGIGTYARASDEADREVGDRANDGIRVEASQLRVKVIGEGANLGVTQAARIEFAARGGRINTDAIDNSAGVDSSDHEVNIKILLSEAMRRNVLPRGDRNTLLASMTDDVARHVLAHNIAQTGALSLAEATVKEDHDELERVMLWLEARGVLDRDVEGLPSSEVMALHQEDGRALTRPEMSVILAWSKITLFDDIVASDLPDDPFFVPVLQAYFPAALQDYSEIMQAHRLKREIVATVLANRLLDFGGPVFLQRLREASGACNSDCVRAFEIAQAALDVRAIEDRIDTAGPKVPAAARTQLRMEMTGLVLDVATRLLTIAPEGDIGALCEHYAAGFKALREGAAERATSYELSRMDRRRRRLARGGAPDKLALEVCIDGLVSNGVDLIDIASHTKAGIDEIADVFNALSHALKIDRLRAGAGDSLGRMSQWERMATCGQLNGMLDGQLAATRAVMEDGADVKAFLSARSGRVEALTQDLRRMELARGWSFAKFALATDAVRAALG